MVLFPPRRSYDNLIYLIFPLSLVVCATAIYYPTIPADWPLITALFISVLALLLYFFEPDVVLHRIQMRKYVWKGEVMKNLKNRFSLWNSITDTPGIGEADIAGFTEMIYGNVVSGEFINIRIIRLRALDNFIVSWLFYFLGGTTLLLKFMSIRFLNPLYQIGWLVASIIFLIVFMLLLYARGQRNVYTGNLSSHLLYITEYEFARLLFGVNQLRDDEPSHFLKAIMAELEYLDRVLNRGDLNLFSQLWSIINGRLDTLANEKTEAADEAIMPPLFFTRSLNSEQQEY